MTNDEALAKLETIADLRRRLMEAGAVQGTMQTPYATYYELTELWNNLSDQLFAIAKHFAAELRRHPPQNEFVSCRYCGHMIRESAECWNTSMSKSCERMGAKP